MLVEGRAGEGKTTLLVNAVLTALNRHFLVAFGADRLSFSATSGIISARDNCQIIPLLGDSPRIPRLRAWLAAQGTTPSVQSTQADIPLLVALDDLHELNDTSAKMLAALPSHTLSNPVLWLLSRCERCGNQDVARLFALDHSQVTRVRLQPLTPQETVALITELIDVPPAPELLELTAQAAGNRLLIVELIKGLRAEHDRSALRTGAGLRDAALPERLLSAVDRLLSLVSADCRQVLEVAAASGAEVSLSRLAALTGEAAGALLPLLLEAINVGVLVTGPDDRLRFAQELLRRALIARVPSQVLHDLAGAGRPAARSDVAVVPAPREQPEGDRHLRSHTEREIARLVSDGLTNGQIAVRMALSPHTVNYHLRKIFRRLSIRSRVELATWVHQRDWLAR